ncbi:MAG: amidohydrolase family protein [Myxococcales bacterium]|nr:amidohydrolase family protein [Myxococcales bacterium]
MRALISGGILVTAAIVALLFALRPPEGLPAPAAGFALVDVTVIEAGQPSRTHQTVRGAERIHSIEPSRPGETGPFAGRFVLPGLVDLHVHHPPRFAVGERELFALLFLAHGVTSVRDTGAIGGDLLEFRRRLRAGETAGPRLFACGPPLDGEPVSWSGSVVVADEAEARAAVARQAERGFDCVKLYNGLWPEALRGAEEEAIARGLPVVGHVPDAVPFHEIRHTEIQHLMGLVDSRWNEVPEPLVARYVRHSADAKLAHLPTLGAIARWGTLDAYDLPDDPNVRLLPPHYREWIWRPAHNPLVSDLAPSRGSEAIERLEFMRYLVGRLHAAGVPILAGSDTLNPFVVPGVSLLEELEHLQRAGLSAQEVLASATRGAARALGRGDLGAVRVGAAADLIVLREDPSHDLAALRTLEAVVVGGRLYRRESLERALAAKSAHWEQPWVRALWSFTARSVLAWIRFFEA